MISADLLLENERVLLRRMVPADFENLVHFAEREPDIWTYSLTHVAGRDHFREYVDAACRAFECGESFPWIIFDKQANAFAGSTRYYDIQWANQSLQLGYTWYGKDFQRTGLNRHCKFLLLQHAFENMGMERVEFRADAGNERSVKAMKNIGCQVEGILRSHLPRASGGRRDSVILSILKSDWETNVKVLLASKCS